MDRHLHLRVDGMFVVQRFPLAAVIAHLDEQFAVVAAERGGENIRIALGGHLEHGLQAGQILLRNHDRTIDGNRFAEGAPPFEHRFLAIGQDADKHAQQEHAQRQACQPDRYPHARGNPVHASISSSAAGSSGRSSRLSTIVSKVSCSPSSLEVVGPVQHDERVDEPPGGHLREQARQQHAAAQHPDHIAHGEAVLTVRAVPTTNSCVVTATSAFGPWR